MSFKYLARLQNFKSFLFIGKHFYSTKNFNSIIVSKTGDNECLGLIQLNRPKFLNAINPELVQEVFCALEDFQNDNGIKCVILTGSEKSFAAGADIKDMAGKSYSEVFRTDFLNDWDKINQLKKPLIAAVNGYALGGGCELAMMADIIYAGDNAKFAQPEIKLGTIPGAGGTQRLTKIVGKSLAMELVLSGDSIDAQEALRCGLVSKVFPSKVLLDETVKLGNRIARMSAVALKAAKQAVNASLNSSLDVGLSIEKMLFYGTFATDDRAEGMKAFVEKRPANFKDS